MLGTSVQVYCHQKLRVSIIAYCNQELKSDYFSLKDY